MPKITITVKTMKGAVVNGLQLDTEADDMRSLKRKICAKLTGLSEADELRIIYRAKPLKDDVKSLSAAGIKQDCILHLVVRFNGGAPRGGAGLKEVMKQVKDLEKAKLFGVQLVDLDDDHPMTVNIMLKGAAGTPFQNRQLSMSLEFPSTYPLAPPSIKFNHPLFHPNVFPEDNSLCWHDDDNTGSSYSLEGIIGAVNTLMETPNPDSPANRAAAALYVKDKKAWHKKARAEAEDALFAE